MLAGELHQLLAAVRSSSAVMVFVHRPGALEPEIIELVTAEDVPSEDAFVLHIRLAD